MDLLNYIIILGKTYLWTCRCNDTKPSFNHFERILLIIKPKSIFLLNQITSIRLRKNGKFFNHVVTVDFKIITYLQYFPVFVKSNDK